MNGDALTALRAFRQLTPDALDTRAGLPAGTSAAREADGAEAERWGRMLAALAVMTNVPVARLVSPTGRAADAAEGGCGARLRLWRERRGIGPAQAAAACDMPSAAYESLERGDPAFEAYAIGVLRIADALNVAPLDLVAPA